jgi:hypothetical protein
MRKFHLLVSTLVIAAAGAAQSPLSMPFSGNNFLSVGAQIFFDLDVTATGGVTISNLDVNTGLTPAGLAGTVEVYTGPTTYVGSETNGAAWTLAGSGAVTAQGDNVPSPVCLSPGIFLAHGRHGIAIRHVGVVLRYTNGNGTNQSGSTSEMTLTAGAAQAQPFSSAPISPRVFNGNIYYATGNVSVGPCASRTPYGTGCYAGTTTFYQAHTNLAAFDLGGTSSTTNVVKLVASGAAGYQVVRGLPTFFTPTSAPVLDNSSPPQPMDDDSYSQPLSLPFTFPFPTGSTNVIHANANGFLILGATFSVTGGFSIGVPALLEQFPRLCPVWADLHPARNLSVDPAAGVYFDVDPSGNIAYVTWRDVGEYSTQTAGGTSLTFQVALHRSGDVEFRYRTMTIASGSSDCITGFSKGSNDGNNSVDPGSTDISAAMPFTTAGPDRIPLVLDTSSPRLGTRLSYVTSNIPSPSGLGATIVSLGQINPGLGLSSLGMPGCFQYVDLARSATILFVGAPSVTIGVNLPASPVYAGQQLFVQSVAFQPGSNALGAITSNGVALTVGH